MRNPSENAPQARGCATLVCRSEPRARQQRRAFVLVGTVSVVGAAACGGATSSAGAHDSGSADVYEAGAVDSSTGYDASETGIAKDAGEAGDAPPEADLDAADSSEADVVACGPGDAFPALTPSSSCTTAALALPAGMCVGDGGACPVTAFARLACTATGYGPWVAPLGTNGGSVYVVDNVGGFHSHLFTLTPGQAPTVQDLAQLTSAANVLRTDATGLRHVVAGEMPGLWEVGEGSTGWTRRDIAPLNTGGDLYLASDARFVDGTTAHAVGFRLSDNALLLASRAGSCWTQTFVNDNVVAYPGLDVDTMGRPWVAWASETSQPTTLVRLREPNGAILTIAQMSSSVLDVGEMPRVVTGGLDGAGAWPVVAALRNDGLHVLVPDAAGSTWQDTLVPGAAVATTGGNCPTNMPPNGCQGQTTCTATYRGGVGRWGIARAANGNIYVAYVDADTSTDYVVSENCFPGGPACACNSQETATHGTRDLVVARLSPAALSPVLRVRYDNGGSDLTGAGARTFEMSVRGNQLLVAAPVASSQIDLRYFEVDVSAL
jgi:hypothetical protein